MKIEHLGDHPQVVQIILPIDQSHIGCRSKMIIPGMEYSGQRYIGTLLKAVIPGQARKNGILTDSIFPSVAAMKPDPLIILLRELIGIELLLNHHLERSLNPIAIVCHQVTGVAVWQCQKRSAYNTGQRDQLSFYIPEVGLSMPLFLTQNAEKPQFCPSIQVLRLIHCYLMLKLVAFQHLVVETTWLADHLNEPNLRILDSTVFLRPSSSGVGLTIESGRTTWAQGHIPGSGFADLIEAFSDSSSSLLFTLPSAEQFAAAIEELGVSEGVSVVIYDQAQNTWAARLWWLFRTFGFDNAAVLNGGWKKWSLEGLPTSTDIPTFARGHFVSKLRPELIANKEEVLVAVNDGQTCLINALSADQHEGRVPVSNGRRGHIPSSVNIPAGGLVDPTTSAYLPLEQLRAKAIGATWADKVITYCGGGIAASSDAFVLTLLGVPHVAVYDGSLSEWTVDPTLPLETGTA